MSPPSCHFQPPLSRTARLSEHATSRARLPASARPGVRRYPAPTARWALAGAHGCPVRPCARLLDALEDLPRETWADIGRQIAAGPWRETMGAPVAALEAALTARRLGAIAWYVRDAVETAAHLAFRRRSTARVTVPASRAWWDRGAEHPADRGHVGAARQALGHAALALLVRPWLAPAHVDTLTAPIALVTRG